MKTAFIGHRKLLNNDIEQRLKNAVIQEIESGCKYFIMGTHGDFDKLALKVCHNLRKKYTDIVIEVVLTSLHSIDRADTHNPYDDASSSTNYIEYADDKVYQRNTNGNKNSKNNSNSGTTTALLYAKKQGLNIINLYTKEDDLFYKISTKEVEIL